MNPSSAFIHLAETFTLAQQTIPTPPYRPFIDPIDVHGYWWALLLPMAFLISLAYKAVKVKDLRGYWQAVVKMTAEIVIGMILLGAASYVVVEVFARWVAEHRVG